MDIKGKERMGGYETHSPDKRCSMTLESISGNDAASPWDWPKLVAGTGQDW